ncbi:MAG TPA: hypothetical protein VHC50_09845 [Puia sp.]|jgi:hypothetical protein|nr:hypothetical protein [Puia sp.]
MNLNYRDLVPKTFAPGSRVWIYQSSRLFSISEVLQLEEILNDFVKEWLSHGSGVKGFASVFFGQFIILMADETETAVGGCSTDSSVRMIKSIEIKFGVHLFDRQSLAFVVKDKVQLLPYTQLAYAVENGFIGPETLYFNNTVQTKAELEKNWIIPVKSSWLKNRIVFRQLSD